MVDDLSNPPPPTKHIADIIQESRLGPAAIGMITNETAGTLSITYGTDRILLINMESFDATVMIDGKPAVGINRNNLLHLEPYRQKKTKAVEVEGSGELPADAIAAAAAAGAGEDRHKGKKVVGYWEDGLAIYEDGTREEKPSAEEEAAEQRRLQEAAVADDDWTEYFGGHTDTRPHGPASVGLDVVFYGSEHLYGPWPRRLLTAVMGMGSMLTWLARTYHPSF